MIEEIHFGSGVEIILHLDIPRIQMVRVDLKKEGTIILSP
jgi:hypothetical protein